MEDFKLIKSQEGISLSSSSFSSNFKTESADYSVVTIAAKASAWWQNWPQFLRRLFKDDNLVVKLDNYPLGLKWNGNDLKGLEQINIFFAKLSMGAHTLTFKTEQTPIITNIKVYEIKVSSPDLTEILPPEIQDSDRRPIYKLAFIGLSPTKILVKADVKTGRDHRLFQDDDDNLQVVVDNKIIENRFPKAHKNWFWCGRAQKYQNTSIRILDQDFPSSDFTTIDFNIDRTPKIEELRVFLDHDNVRPIFNKFLVIDDSEFVDLTMTYGQIDSFLREKAKNQTKHIAFRLFEGKSTAEIIYQACKNNLINPKVILAKLQAEQGLIEGVLAENPSKNQLNSALGVGVLDDGTVQQQYQGFANQINGAAETLRKNFDKANEANFGLDNVDGRKLIVKNAATFSLYSYTPHVAGAELFFDIYQNFFGR